MTTHSRARVGGFHDSERGGVAKGQVGIVCRGMRRLRRKAEVSSRREYETNMKINSGKQFSELNERRNGEESRGKG